MRTRAFFLALLTFLSFLPAPASAARTFQLPPSLLDEVRFWKAVFGTYDASQVLIYDSRHLEVVYEVVDFSLLNARKDLSAQEKRRMRSARIREETDRIIRALKTLASNPPPAALGEEELYVRSLFEEVPGRVDFAEAAQRVRIQAGQRGSLMRAIAKSQDWAGDMEAIFEKHGLPRDLIALVFVESMFNPRALSEVGASGLWQFMPETGRDYLSMNAFWDDRNDPINSSMGAALFLRDLYEQTGDWALAVNSYHSGPGRILNAVRQLKTKDIGEIIARYNDPGYGFYSRNYYPEFLAVAEIYRHRDEYFGPVPEGPDLRYDIVQTRDFVNLPEVVDRFAIGVKEISKLNTALKPEVLEGRLPLPPNYLLKVPKGFGYYLAKAIGYTGKPARNWTAEGEKDLGRAGTMERERNRPRSEAEGVEPASGMNVGPVP